MLAFETRNLDPEVGMSGPVSWGSQSPEDATLQLQQTLERERRREEARAAMDQKHAELGGGPGAAVSEVESTGDGGFVRRHQHGALYWHAAAGCHHVYGAIHEKYLKLNGPKGLLGFPTTDETGVADGAGRFNRFQDGSISWHPQIGAHEVHGDIYAKWASLGHEAFGYPTTDESAGDRDGRFNHFRAFGGGGSADKSIYWTPATGAHEVHGDIRDKWAGLGWERGYLGYPTSDEMQMDLPPGLPVRSARANHFEQGTIMWTPSGGAVVAPAERKFSANVSAETVSGWCELRIRADGKITYSGHLHESGALNHHYYIFTAIQLHGSPTGPLIAAHTGTVRGTFGLGSRDDDWHGEDTSESIRQQWPLIASSPEQLTKMTVSTGPMQILEAMVAAGLGAAGVSTGVQTGSFLLFTL